MADPRTRAVDLPGMDGPSVTTTQPTPIAAPQMQVSDQPFQILSQAFNNFYGKGEEGLAAIEQAAKYSQKQNILGQFYLARAAQRQQAEQNTKQGAVDALAGNPQNPALSADQSYAQAYAKTAGQQHGFDLFGQWYNQVYKNAAPGDNLATQTDAFLKQEYGQGTGNPDYDAAALSHFKGMTDRLVLEHQQNSVKAVVSDGLQSLDSVVAGMARSGQLSPDSMNELAARYRALDPMNPAAAPLRLAHALSAGYDGTPAYAQNVSSWMNQPGTGVNGKSFAESFPEEAQKTQKQLVSDYTHVNSIDGLNAYQKAKEDLFNAKTAQDYTNVLASVEKVRQQYGGVSEFNTIRQAAAAQLDKFAEQETSINSIGQMAVHAMPVDPKVVNTYFDAYLDKMGVDPMKDPYKAGYIASQLGMVPAGLKDNMSRAMEDPTNPTGQIAAFNFYHTIAAAYNDPMAAKREMSDTAKAVFDYAEELRKTQGDNLPQIFQQIGQNMDVVRKGKEVTWATLTGQKEADAVTAVNNQIGASLKGSIWNATGVFQDGRFSNSENVTIDPLTQRTLADVAKNAALIAGRNGQSDWKSSVDQTIQNAKDRLEIIPGNNGAAMVRFKEMPDYAPDGKTPLVHFGVSVMNPATRQPEDTLATYRSDLGDLAKALPGVVPDTSRVSIATQSLMPGADRGVYQVQRDGRSINFVPGQDLDVLGTKQTLSKDFTAAGKQLQILLPQTKGGGWVLVPNDPVSPSGYMLGYQPRLTGEAKTLDQKASEYQGSAAQRQRNQQQQIETQFPAAAGGGL